MDGSEEEEDPMILVNLPLSEPDTDSSDCVSKNNDDDEEEKKTFSSRRPPAKKKKKYHDSHSIIPIQSKVLCEIPPADGTCCFDWLPAEDICHIVDMLRPSYILFDTWPPRLNLPAPSGTPMKLAPMLRRDQWASAMVCRRMRDCVDCDILRYLRWGSLEHDQGLVSDITHVTGKQQWITSRGVKFLQTADADDPKFMRFAFTRVHLEFRDWSCFTKSNIEASHIVRCDERLLFDWGNVVAAAMGSINVLRYEELQYWPMRSHFRMWMDRMYKAAAARGRCEIIDHLEWAERRIFEGYRTRISTIDSTVDRLLAPAIRNGQRNTLDWVVRPLEKRWHPFCSDEKTRRLVFVKLLDDAVASPDPEAMVIWLLEHLDLPVTPGSTWSLYFIHTVMRCPSLNLLERLYPTFITWEALNFKVFWQSAASCGYLHILVWAYHMGFQMCGPDLCSQVKSHTPCRDFIISWIHGVFGRCPKCTGDTYKEVVDSHRCGCKHH